MQILNKNRGKICLQVKKKNPFISLISKCFDFQWHTSWWSPWNRFPASLSSTQKATQDSIRWLSYLHIHFWTTEWIHRWFSTVDNHQTFRIIHIPGEYSRKTFLAYIMRIWWDKRFNKQIDTCIKYINTDCILSPGKRSQEIISFHRLNCKLAIFVFQSAN